MTNEDSQLLPNWAGQRARAENRCKRIERAAQEVDRAWDRWIESEQDKGFDTVVKAIGRLRKALTS
jgi:hypothetical protein